MTNTVTCIKTVTTKSGISFKAGKSYDFNINNGAIRVYVDRLTSVVIRKESIFNKFFK